MKAWFVSDIHLKNLNERNGNILLRFLLSLRNKQRSATHLFLLGDIFDFWVGDHSFYHEKFKPIVDLLIDIKSSGVEIYYFEGNHDVHVKRFWERYQIPCSDKEGYFQLGELQVRVEHGDFINPSELNYLRYRSFIRKPYMEKVAQLLPAKQLHEVGKIASLASSKRSRGRRIQQTDKFRELIRKYAVNAYDEKPFDLIVTGHMHLLDDWCFEKNQKQIRSINLGSWFEEPRALLVSSEATQWELLT